MDEEADQDARVPEIPNPGQDKDDGPARGGGGHLVPDLGPVRSTVYVNSQCGEGINPDVETVLPLLDPMARGAEPEGEIPDHSFGGRRRDGQDRFPEEPSNEYDEGQEGAPEDDQCVAHEIEQRVGQAPHPAEAITPENIWV